MFRGAVAEDAHGHFENTSIAVTDDAPAAYNDIKQCPAMEALGKDVNHMLHSRLQSAIDTMATPWGSTEGFPEACLDEDGWQMPLLSSSPLQDMSNPICA